MNHSRFTPRSFPRWLRSIIVGLALVAGITSASAAQRFRFIAGMTYISDLDNMTEAIEANHPVRMDVLWPVALTLRGEYEVAKNLSLGLSVGPALIALGDVSFNVIPIGAEATYSIPTANNARPYVRVGLQQPLVGGDFVDGGSAGVTGGVGCEFGKNSKVGWGLELGYSGAKVGVTTRRGTTLDTKPYGLTAALFARF